MYFSILASVSLLGAISYVWEWMDEASDKFYLDLGDTIGLTLTRSELNKIPWHVKISRILLNERGYSQSQPKVCKI